MVGEVGALPAQDLLDLAPCPRSVDASAAGAARRARRCLARSVSLDGVLQDLGHQRAAVKLLQMRAGTLPLRKPLSWTWSLTSTEALGERLPSSLGGMVTFSSRLSTFAEGFGYLHALLPQIRRQNSDFSPRAERPAHSPECWCGRRDSNPHGLRHRNLNPARLPVPPRLGPGNNSYQVLHGCRTLRV